MWLNNCNIFPSLHGKHARSRLFVHIYVSKSSWYLCKQKQCDVQQKHLFACEDIYTNAVEISKICGRTSSFFVAGIRMETDKNFAMLSLYVASNEKQTDIELQNCEFSILSCRGKGVSPITCAILLHPFHFQWKYMFSVHMLARSHLSQLMIVDVRNLLTEFFIVS